MVSIIISEITEQDAKELLAKLDENIKKSNTWNGEESTGYTYIADNGEGNNIYVMPYITSEYEELEFEVEIKDENKAYFIISMFGYMLLSMEDLQINDFIIIKD